MFKNDKSKEKAFRLFLWLEIIPTVGLVLALTNVLSNPLFKVSYKKPKPPLLINASYLTLPLMDAEIIQGERPIAQVMEGEDSDRRVRSE